MLSPQCDDDLTRSLSARLHVHQAGRRGQVHLTLTAIGRNGEPLLTLLTNILASGKLLLILDNCEHLIEACARLAEHLLDHCQGLRILATSREALGIEGETVLHLPSLSLPAAEHTLEQLADSEAVQLFIDRTNTVKPGYNLNHANAAAIAQICRRLDGIALAIELAASRVKLLQVEQIAARLDDAFQLLTGGSRTALPRQQTLRATIDWSYNLLSQDERLLFQRLAVFAGGWSLEAAEQVCVGTGIAKDSVLDLLSKLESKSLVVCDREDGDMVRFRLLEATRLYAREKLAEHGDVDWLREQHLEWCLGLAEAFEQQVGSNARVWMKLLGTEIDNLRAGLEWAFSGADQANCRAGVRILVATWRYWDMRGHYLEQCGWLERALAKLAGDSDEAEYLRGRLLLDLGNVLLWWLQQSGRGRAVMAEGISTLRRFMPAASAVLPHRMALLAFWEDDPVLAQSLVEESIAIGRRSESSDKASLARALYWRAAWYAGRNDFATAHASADESLRLSRQHGYAGTAGIGFKVKGDIAVRQGELAAARVYYEESVPLLREAENLPAVAGVVAHLGGIDLATGNYEGARARFADSTQIDKDLRSEEGYHIHRTYEAIAALFQGDLEFADSRLRQSLPHTGGSLDDVAVGLAGLAYLANQQGDAIRGGRLLGAAAAIVASMGKEFERRTAYTRASYYRLLEMCRDGLDRVAWEEGYRMTVDHAIEYALQNGRS